MNVEVFSVNISILLTWKATNSFVIIWIKIHVFCNVV